MLSCNCSLAGTTSCLTCERYLAEMRKAGSTTFTGWTGWTIPSTPVRCTFYYNSEKPIIEKYKKRLQEDIRSLEQDLMDYLKENNYSGAAENQIIIEATKHCLKLIEKFEVEK